MRLAALAGALLLAGAAAAQVASWAGPDAFVAAPGRDDLRLTGATDRYPHDVLGGIPGWTTLRLGASAVTLPVGLVFEDVTPRLWDVTGDGRPEIVVVQSDDQRGARLTVWSAETGQTPALIAASDFIGTRFRWLAPIAAADLDGDGRVEIAWIDRPHLARELVLARVAGDRIVEIARLPGLTNHRIGEATIFGGLAVCDGGPELRLASGDWSRLVGITLSQGAFRLRDRGALPVADPLAC